MDLTRLSLAIGAVVHGALYFVAVVALAIATACMPAAILAVLGLGVTYLSFLVQIQAPGARGAAWVLVVASIILGVLAGFWLLLWLAI
jgi:hypothetical protein